MSESQYESGSAKYGNFLNYYSFYPPDERIRLIPFNLLLQDFSENYVCLDVGCNSGELTNALYNKIINHDDEASPRNCKILAIDIDPLLIERAKEANTNQSIKFECFDVLNNEFSCFSDYFLRNHCKEIFDIVFLFSVTMWIHLNNGDEGLKLFLKIISKQTEVILLEPQPWKCYKAAVRRRKRAKKKMFQFWSEIKLKETIEYDLVRILCEECSFELVWKSERTSWGREICLFRKKQDDCKV